MNIVRRIPPESFVELADVDAVIPMVLERGKNYFVDLWHNQSDSKITRLVLEVLVCAPGNQLGRQELQKVERDERVLRKALAVLLRREIIERGINGYRITIPIVAEYVRSQMLV